MFDDDTELADSAIVIDPAVPEPVRRALESTISGGSPAARMLGYPLGTQRVPAPGARGSVARYGRLIPFRQPAPVLRPPQVMSGVARKARNLAAATVLCLAGALTAAAAGSIPFVVVFLILTAITTATCVRAVVDANDTGWTTIATEPNGARRSHDPGNWYLRHAAAYYHRRYVLPHTDMDDADRPVWARAVAAANAIRESEVIRQQLIDSAQVAVELPQRLWEIAEGLARLSEVRGHQREIVGRAQPDDPHVAVKVTRQTRKLTLAAGHIDRRVAKLEEFAGLLAKADALNRQEAALGQLRRVDEMLLELLASTGDTPSDLDLTERLRLEVQAVIEQANEAARGLALADDYDEDELDA